MSDTSGRRSRFSWSFSARLFHRDDRPALRGDPRGRPRRDVFRDDEKCIAEVRRSVGERGDAHPRGTSGASAFTSQVEQRTRRCAEDTRDRRDSEVDRRAQSLLGDLSGARPGRERSDHRCGLRCGEALGAGDMRVAVRVCASAFEPLGRRGRIPADEQAPGPPVGRGARAAGRALGAVRARGAVRPLRADCLRPRAPSPARREARGGRCPGGVHLRVADCGALCPRARQGEHLDLDARPSTCGRRGPAGAAPPGGLARSRVGAPGLRSR